MRREREPEEDRGWIDVGLKVVPVLLVAYLLRSALGTAEDGWEGFLVLLALVVVLAPPWGYAVRAARRRRRDA